MLGNDSTIKEKIKGFTVVKRLAKFTSQKGAGKKPDIEVFDSKGNLAMLAEIKCPDNVDSELKKDIQKQLLVFASRALKHNAKLFLVFSEKDLKTALNEMKKKSVFRKLKKKKLLKVFSYDSFQCFYGGNKELKEVSVVKQFS
jgi:hypothetical protein